MKKNKKKNKLILMTIVMILLFCIALFFWGLTPVKKSNESITFKISAGDSKQEIVTNLKSANLIHSKYITLAYIVLTGKTNIQAGNYELNRNMSTQDIINILATGQVIEEKKPTTNITFKEGITLKEYLQLLAEKTNLEYDNIITEINNKEYLTSLINDYWFLTEDILDSDIYYNLEGYLYPETYEFYIDTSLDTVIRKMLDVAKNKLEPLKEEIENSSLSVHEILTIASIAEKEALTYEDRCKVTQVIFKRLELNMSLGMDVTAYYGVQKELSENNITNAELNDVNPYNTRLVTFLGLPVGPICNPSLESIKAVLNPSETNYIYFYADIKTGIVYFTDKKSEFEEFKRIYG